MRILFEMCSKYFEGNYDIKEWQVGSLTILLKKGDLSNPNNWRSINLLDVISKTISIVIKSRIQIIISVQGMLTQFKSSPKTACPYGSFSIRTLLQIRKEYTLDSWAVFVDLI